MNNPVSNYQAPHTPAAYGTDAAVMTVKDWMITLLILAIPLVNIVMMFVWGFSSGTNPNKANFCKAYLLFFAIIMVLYIGLIMVLGLGAVMGGQAQ